MSDRIEDPGVAGEGAAEEQTKRTPWMFRIIVAAAVLYLALRGVQTVDWIIDRF
jgi:hypothetical protein